MRVQAAIFKLQGDARCFVAAALKAPIGHVTFKPQHLGAGLRDVNIQRVKLRHGGERRCLVGRNQSAWRDARRRGAPRNGRGNARVGQVDARIFQRRSGHGHIGTRQYQRRLTVVIDLATDGIYLHQFSIAPGR